MRKVLFTLLYLNLFLSLGIVKGQNITVFDRDTLIGKVRQLKFNYYNAKDEFGSIKKTIEASTLFKFSKLGRIESAETAPINNTSFGNETNTKFSGPPTSSRVIGDTLDVYQKYPNGIVWKYISIYNQDKVIEERRYKNDTLINVKIYNQDKVIEERRYENDTLKHVNKLFFDNRGNLIQDSDYDGKGKSTSKESKKFDTNNRLLEREYFNVYGYYSKTVNYYNSKGQLAKMISLDQSNEIEDIYLYKYNQWGNISEIANEGESYLFSYDKLGRRLTEERNYKGEPYTKETFKYDQVNRIIESALYTNYNSRGLVISSKELFSYFSNGKIQSKKEFYYNTLDGSINSISIEVYEYDKIGNWVRKIKSYVNRDEDSENRLSNLVPEVTSVEEREIEYY